MRIVGIETSCDETAAAVVDDGVVLRSNVVASQHDLHKEYGGVVPEIASRAHLERIAPVVEAACREAGCALAEVDAIAVGNRPGLIGSLIVGVSAAKALAWRLGKPLVGVDHVKAHLHAAALVEAGEVAAENDAAALQHQAAPVSNALGLVVSGGHTSLYRVDSPTSLELLGRTIDDAVGEAYDKAAVILGLGYPGGPAVDAAAQRGDAKAHRFPRSLLDKRSMDFSFSGLKTALLYAVRGQPRRRGDKTYFERDCDDLTEQQRFDLAASFQAAVVDTLMIKIDRALDRLSEAGRQAEVLIIGGGVSANSLLRKRAMELGEKRGIEVKLPPMALCVDNAAMIAGLAYYQWRESGADGLDLPAMATGA